MRTQSSNLIIRNLMSVSIKVMEQKQKAETKTAQMKKASSRIFGGLLELYKHDNYDIDEEQFSQSNDEANLDEIENLNIG